MGLIEKRETIATELNIHIGGKYIPMSVIRQTVTTCFLIAILYMGYVAGTADRMEMLKYTAYMCGGIPTDDGNVLKFSPHVIDGQLIWKPVNKTGPSAQSQIEWSEWLKNQQAAMD